MKSLLCTCMAAWALFAAAGVTLAAESPKPQAALSLDDCIRMALKAAPELGEAQSDIALATSKLDEAKSYRFPQMELTTLIGPAPMQRSIKMRLRSSKLLNSSKRRGKPFKKSRSFS